jgi:hypothetical protein
MLDHPDENGIYPTGECYKKLYDFVVSQKKKAIASAVAKRELEIADEVEKIKTYTGGSSVNEKDKRVNKAEVLSILKH